MDTFTVESVVVVKENGLTIMEASAESIEVNSLLDVAKELLRIQREVTSKLFDELRDLDISNKLSEASKSSASQMSPALKEILSKIVLGAKDVPVPEGYPNINVKEES
ncbi:hypothetical protein MLD52_08990 [Puniceicoccaceae bacterium K14]|nr:hypothetical protein [Puniceicoccaceae bacterium K14]